MSNKHITIKLNENSEFLMLKLNTKCKQVICSFKMNRGTEKCKRMGKEKEIGEVLMTFLK